jgi:hypothetical protein
LNKIKLFEFEVQTSQPFMYNTILQHDVHKYLQTLLPLRHMVDVVNSS